MSIGPTAANLARRKRAARGRNLGEWENAVPRPGPVDTTVFAAVVNVCLLGVVATAAFAHLAAIGR